MARLNVLHINTQLKSKSATLPYRIHEGFIEKGHNSVFLTADCDDINKYDHVIQVPNQKGSIFLARALRNLWYGKIRGKDAYYYFPHISFRTISMKKIVGLIRNPPDLIIAYWTNLYFTQKLIHYIAGYFKVPILLYLMDEEPYTGGCHMTFNCENYLTGCGNCPALKLNHPYDISYRSFKKKKKWIHNSKHLMAIAATSFAYNRLNKSPLYFNIQKYMMPIPINDKIYEPFDQIKVREKLNLPKYKKIILFGGASFERINKGMKYLIDALIILRASLTNPEQVHILIVGNGEISAELPFDFTHLGYLKTQQEMAEAYQSCDVYVCPTIQDAGPAMINESIMCGRPVVSFDMGVARDLIINHKTGYIVKMEDEKDFAYGIKLILELNEQQLKEMNKNCREIALEKCNMNNFIDRIIEIKDNSNDKI